MIGPVVISLVCDWQLEISVGRVQLNFLHLLSLGAEQSLTVHCLNISVWSPARGLPPSQRSVRFRGWEGASLDPIVLEDTCWVSKAKIARTLNW